MLRITMHSVHCTQCTALHNAPPRVMPPTLQPSHRARPARDAAEGTKEVHRNTLHTAADSTPSEPYRGSQLAQGRALAECVRQACQAISREVQGGQAGQAGHHRGRQLLQATLT